MAVFEGTEGNDTITGTRRDDIFHASLGNDSISGGRGTDVVNFWSLESDFRVTSVTSSGLTIVTEAGTDFVASDVEYFTFGSPANRRWSYSEVADWLEGAPRPAPDDTLRGTSGDDFLSVNTQVRYTRVVGLAGNDTLYSGSGHDTLNGGAGFDSLLGQDGNDLLILGPGGGFADPGQGHDIVNFAGAGDAASILQLSPGDDGRSGLRFDNRLIMDADNTDGRVDKGSGGETTLLNIADAFRGGLSISGSANADLIRVDPLNGMGGELVISGNGGNDRIVIANHRNVEIRLDFFGGTEGATVNLNKQIIRNDGFGDRDRVINIKKVDNLWGTDFNDRLFGNGQRN